MASYRENVVLDTIKANLTAADQSRAELMSRIDFEVTDELRDPRAAAEFELQLNGRGKVRVKASAVAEGPTWGLHNSIAHEVCHFEQSQDPQLADFFILHPNAAESARIGLLMEIDAYVKTQSLMEDLKLQGVISRKPNEQGSFAARIDDMYQQIQDAGYEHDSGDAQTTLFCSMAYGMNGQFAAAYIFPRLEAEIAALEDLQQVVADRSIAEGGLNALNVSQTEAPAPNPSDTVLGRVKGKNFMADEDGKTDFLTDNSFLEVIFDKTPQFNDYLNKLTAQHSGLMKDLKPYLAKPELNRKDDAETDELSDRSWRKSVGQRTGRVIE